MSEITLDNLSADMAAGLGPTLKIPALMGKGALGNITASGIDISKLKTQQTADGTAVSKGMSNEGMDKEKAIPKLLSVVSSAAPASVSEANKIGRTVVPGFTSLNSLTDLNLDQIELLATSISTRIDLEPMQSNSKLFRGLRAIRNILWMVADTMSVKKSQMNAKFHSVGDVRS